MNNINHENTNNTGIKSFTPKNYRNFHKIPSPKNPEQKIPALINYIRVNPNKIGSDINPESDTEIAEIEKEEPIDSATEKKIRCRVIEREKIRTRKESARQSKDVWKQLVETKPETDMSHKDIIRLATHIEKKLLKYGQNKKFFKV